MSQTIQIENFAGGLNSEDATTIEDNQLSIAKNVYYDSQRLLSSRRGISDFGAEVAGANGQHSIYFTRLTDGTRILLLGVGTTVRRYNETTEVFDTIDTGLTDGEKLSFITYKDWVYWSNGIDDMRRYDGATVTPDASLPKGKYLAVDKDVAYVSGVTTDPSAVFYTDANPTTVHADGFSNDEPVNQDDGIITGMHVFGGTAFIGKSVPNRSTGKGMYNVNVFSTVVSIDPIDNGGDLSSDRSMVRVENDLLYMSSTGFYSASQRQGTSGSYRAMSFSNPIQKLMDRVTDKSTVAAVYWPETKNVYVSVNESGTRNNTLYVYSLNASSPGIGVFAWTEYENINANDFTEYEDADGVKHLLVANAYGGQVIEMETGFNDNGISIRTEVQTKTFDFGSAETLKTFSNIDIGGLISRQQDLSFKIITDCVETTKNFNGTDYGCSSGSSIPIPIGREPLGEDVIGGGAVSVDGITLNPFSRFRHPFSTGQRVAINVSGNCLNSAWKLSKARVIAEIHEEDVQKNAFIS